MITRWRFLLILEDDPCLMPYASCLMLLYTGVTVSYQLYRRWEIKRTTCTTTIDNGTTYCYRYYCCTCLLCCSGSFAIRRAAATSVKQQTATAACTVRTYQVARKAAVIPVRQKQTPRNARNVNNFVRMCARTTCRLVCDIIAWYDSIVLVVAMFIKCQEIWGDDRLITERSQQI